MSSPIQRGATSRGLVALGAALLGVLGLAGLDTRLLAGPPEADLADVCQAFTQLKDNLNTTRLRGQVAARAAASRLAVVAGAYPNVRQRDAAPVRSSQASIIAVLHAPYASTRDMFSALKPVAIACGEPWHFRGAIADHRLLPPPTNPANPAN